MSATTNRGGSPTTRPSLLVRIRDLDNQRAWQEFVEIYTPLVYGFCRKRGLQDCDAADVAQEVMRAVSRAIGGFDYRPGPGAFRAWLFCISRNKLSNFLQKRHAAWQTTTAIAASEPALSFGAEPEADWNQEYHRRLFEWACGEVRGEFNERTWQAFWRATVLEESGDDVARALGMSVGAVYVAKSRVRARLRECLASADGEDPVLA